MVWTPIAESVFMFLFVNSELTRVTEQIFFHLIKFNNQHRLSHMRHYGTAHVLSPFCFLRRV